MDRLPSDVATRVVEFVLDYDQISGPVECEQVQPLTRCFKSVELLLKNQQLLAQGVGLMDEPLLQMLALAQCQVAKTLLR